MHLILQNVPSAKQSNCMGWFGTKKHTPNACVHIRNFINFCYYLGVIPFKIITNKNTKTCSFKTSKFQQVVQLICRKTNTTI